MFILIMSSVLPKNIQNVVVNDMTTASSIITPLISTSNLISNTATIPTIMMTGSFHATHTNNTIANIFTTFGNVGIGTTSPGARLDVSGTARVTTSLTTGSLYSTNQTTTNIVSTTITSSTLVGTTASVNNLYGTLGTISNLVGVNLSSSNLTTTTATIPNIIHSNITTNSLFVTNGGLIATFNSNTFGNIFTTGGNVGINTTSPSYRLDVNGTFRATSGDSTLGTLAINTLITSSNISTSLITAGTLLSTFINSGNSNTIGSIFTTAGNVGIGTTAPAQKLHVIGAIAMDNLYQMYLGNTNTGTARLNIKDVNQQLIEFQYGTNTIGNITSFAGIPGLLFNGGGGTSQLVLASTGNVGLGTTSPSVKLQIEDGSVIIGDSPYVSTSVPSAPGNLGTPNGYRLFFDNTINQTAGSGMPANKIVLHNNNWTGGFGIEGQSVTYHSGYSHTFYGNATNTSTYGNAIMMINGAGRVGIMTTSPDTTLHINGPSLQMGTSTNAFNFVTTTGSLYLASGTIGSSYITAFTSTGNVGIGTTTPSNKLDVVGTIRASAGMLLSSSNVFEFGHGISGKSSDAGKIGYNTWTTGLNIVGAGTGASDRLVYVYDHLQVATSVTIPNLRITGTTNITGNASIQATTNNYSLTSGALNVTGDIILSGSELMFTTTSVGAPTMNGRGSGSKIVLYPETNVTRGDYSIGIESAYMWFQTPALTATGYKFYQGTTPNLVIIPNGNVGIGTTAPVTKLHVEGNLYLPLGSRVATASISDNFIYSGSTIGHYSLLWNNDTAEAGGAMSYISGYGGLRVFSNGTPHLNLTRLGNFGIGTVTPVQTLDVNGNVALSNASGSKMFLGNSTTGAARLNIRDFSNNLIEFQYSTNTIGNINCLSNGTGLLLHAGGTNQLVLASTGNVGIGNTIPSTTLDISGTFRVSSSRSNAMTFNDPVTGTTLDFSVGNRGGAQLGGWTTLDPNGGTTGSSGVYIWDGLWVSASNQYVFNTTGLGIGTTSPAYLLDVNGTIDALTVTTGNLSNGTATIGTLLNTTIINYGMSAQWVVNGGGTVTWSGSGSLLWNTRVIIIPVKRSELSSVGYIDINCPTSSTITYYNSANVTTTVTCTASGVPIGDWDALYYEITPGQAATHDQTKFRLVHYSNTTWKPTSNWILIAVKNGDNGSLKWIPGNSYIPLGGTFNNYAIFNNAGSIGIGSTSTNFLVGGKLALSSGVNGLPATTGTNGNAIALRIRGNDNATLDFGANSINTWLQATDFVSGYNNNYHIHLNPNGGNVAIGNGGSTPTYKFQVNGNGGFTGNLYVNYAGAAGLPQLQVSPNSNAAESSIGFWQNTNNAGAAWVIGHNPGSAGSDKFAIYSGTFGGNALTIQNDGNVGLNNNSPGTRLHVYQNRDNEAGILCENPNSGASAYAALRLKTNVANNGYIFLNSTAKTNDGPALCMTMRNDTGDLRLQSAGGNGIYISSTSGNVGIGTTPGLKLDVSGDCRVSGYFRPSAGSGSNGILFPDNPGGGTGDTAWIKYYARSGEGTNLEIGVSNDADDHIYLNPSGGVGIATNVPGFKLHVNGNMRADNIYNNGWFRNYGDQGLYNEDYGCHFLRNDAQYGNWRIYGNAMNNWNGLRFTQAEISLMAGDGATKRCGFHYNGTGWGLYVDENRNLYIPGDITAYWSDKRLKTNLQKLEHFDDVLCSLTGYTFNWNEKGQEILQRPADELDVGLIAQDVQAVIPQAVKVNKAGQKIDEEDPFEYLTINYDKIVPFLIEGYKAQRDEINDLKSKIQQLEELIQQILTK